MSVIPETYEDWEHCITVKCDIPLTADFVAERIEALQDMNDHSTRRFIDRWGDAHHKRTLAWFQEAGQRLNR
ncbi:MAG: hypothetical protein AAGA26_05360 [Pseudomonadota bacterium]